MGKSYSSAIEIYHKHYKYWGDSLFFNSEYSEARAGSGELKVINMVTQIKKAPDQSLILIDEPEISLHPGAQLQLLKFLLTEIRDKNHQIVFTTHSPTMIKYLPSECIRLFKKDPSFDKFYIEENVDPTLAFENIGEPITNKMNIIVEDKMAKKILDAIIKSDKSLSKSAFNVMHIPGGAKDLICSTIPQHMYSKNIYFILDGDQNFSSNNYESYLDIPLRKTNNPNQYLLELQHKIYSLTQVKHSSIKFTKNSNETCDDTIKRYETFLSFYENNVKFFPQQIPEDILWNAKDLNDLLFQNSNVKTKIEELNNNSNLTSKNKIYELASFMSTNDKNLTNRYFDLLIDILIKHFVNNPKNSDYNNILTILKHIQRNLA